MSRLWLYAESPASLSCTACSSDTIPSVQHTSMSISRTSRTICRMRRNIAFFPPSSRHAVPMQKRVEPAAFARFAASITSITGISGVDFTEVV